MNNPQLHTGIRFQPYQQDLRVKGGYVRTSVRKRFYEALEMIGGVPEHGERFMFLSVHVRDGNDWCCANNAMNAFEYKFNEKLRGNYGKKHMMPFVPCLEVVPEGRYKDDWHFHTLIKITDILQARFEDHELMDIAREILSKFREINTRKQSWYNADVFYFDENMVNSREDEFGVKLHYCVKSSNHTHNPLCREIYNKQQRKEHQML
jgi:hypothetical protein